MIIQSEEYKKWLAVLKGKIRSTQVKAAIAVNSALIEFYWDLGKMISEKENVWGRKLVETVAIDLKKEFPEINGLSRSNLFYCKQFYNFNSLKLVQQPVGQLKNDDNKPIKSSEPLTWENILQIVSRVPWGHNIIIFQKSKGLNESFFYLQKTIENNWSREVLDIQIKSNLYERQGKSVNNFIATLPIPLSDLATQTLKDPYIFDFLTMDENLRERDIENQLIQHISRFLLELGKGFAFIARQYELQVENNSYFIDLFFYHTKLKCYVVIEIKNTKFQPEYTGKLNFYLSAVDSLIKDQSDNPTIGILLCKDKNNIEAEFALRDLNKPIGISEIKFVENIPDNLKSSLPTIEEIENEMKKYES